MYAGKDQFSKLAGRNFVLKILILIICIICKGHSPSLQMTVQMCRCKCLNIIQGADVKQCPGSASFSGIRHST